jgi:hypothetical protein
VKVFRNLVEAINSLGNGKVLISTEEYLFNKKLAFYQKDIFENFSLDKYKMNYGEVGAHILIRYFYSNGIDFSNDFSGLSSHTAERLIFVRSGDFLGLSERLAQHASNLDYLKEEIVYFIQSSGKELSRLTDSYDYLLFSRFRSESVVTPQLLDGEGKKWLNSISRFWKNLVFGDSEVYDKFLSVFDGELREYVAKTVSISDQPSGYDSFSLPFGYFDRGTRPLAFEGNSVGGGVGLFSYNSALSPDRITYGLPRLLISKGYYTPEEKYGDVFPRILGFFGFYFNIDKDVIIVPIESEYEEGEKTVILHVFYVGTLINDHFNFYVDGRKKVNKEKVNDYWYPEYRIFLYPNQEEEEGKGKIFLDVEEKIGVDLTWADKEEGVEELRLQAELLLNASSSGEVVEVGDERNLVPQGSRITKGGTLFIHNFSFRLHPSLFDAYEEFNPIKLDRNKKLIDFLTSILVKVENRFLSDLPSFNFIYRRVLERGSNKEVKEIFSFRDKKFLLRAVELVLKESLNAIRSEMKKIRERGVEGFLYSFVTNKLSTTEISSFGYSTSEAFSVEIPFYDLERYQERIFKERRLYSKFIDYPDPKLCFDSEGVGVIVDFPRLYNKKVRDLAKGRIYKAFVQQSSPEEANKLSREHIEVYSLFLDLVPHDPSLVKYLSFKGLHEIFSSKSEIGKRIMRNLADPLDFGVIYTKWGMEIEIRIEPAQVKEGKVYYVVPKDKYRVGNEIYEETFLSGLRNYKFEYRMGKNAIEIFGS